ncbi:hypothetical protein OJ252_1444 [Cryptosporidium canis]|uniref:Uncharacterized protein n=1 Tax=Cryptosporidium canis TaxID=195482 RepID=A0ABQ8P822_9CRYT|nr:hypothetical protein OJ252_1444 [Cryptosporidium canis]
MSDFDTIESRLAKIRELRSQVEGIERTSLSNIKNRAILDKNVEISICPESSVEERCRAICLLYLVNQKRLIREIVQELGPERLKLLTLRMIGTPPLGEASIEKMACNRNIWIDECVWQLSKAGASTQIQETGSSSEAETLENQADEGLSEILQSLSNYKHHLESSLQLGGALNLVIGMLDSSSVELDASSK